MPPCAAPTAEQSAPDVQGDAAPLSEVRTLLAHGRKGAPAQLRSVWRETRLRPGLWVTLLDTPRGGVSFDYEKDNALVDFGFILRGAVRHTVRTGRGATSEMDNRAGCAGLGFVPGLRGTARIPSDSPARLVHVHASRDFLRDLLGEDVRDLPAPLRDLLVHDRSRHLLLRDPMDPATHTAAVELHAAVSGGPASRLYLEAKALELVALQLAGLQARKDGGGARAPLSPAERERIRAARDLLVENLNAPPTLAGLSDLLALSTVKLQAGFRELYGTSVFGFLREYRLQRAKTLLEQADMNVSEVAWEIGYINLSHFSAAYRKRFGVLPKHQLRSARRRAAPVTERPGS
ncbi:MAG: helix-turn-helix transcriptional regulator [Desulfovibrionaceae bacterium]|jgi:AraC-like DNA-binding protein|nr:helix-turn-helix transcriptional regulator [Desulfovibrionaceae bacterium]